MATHHQDRDLEHLKEANRLLKRALDECAELTAHVERMIRKSDQDNDPPSALER